MKFLLLAFFTIPFVIAAAFHYTDWMGWPTLFVGGLYWIGVCVSLGEKK